MMAADPLLDQENPFSSTSHPSSSFSSIPPPPQSTTTTTERQQPHPIPSLPPLMDNTNTDSAISITALRSLSLSSSAPNSPRSATVEPGHIQNDQYDEHEPHFRPATTIGISPLSASTSSSTGGSKSSMFTNPARRAPDMQMGKCPWVRVYDNVTYIVASIALRNGIQGREVLLMQEAKEKCRGKWYMPAGHVEPGETIEEAVKRELREETGMECEPETLLCMEVRGSGWYRLAFAVRVTGGKLKQKADQESLTADWHPLAKLRNKPCPLALRCRDFLDILSEAERFADWKAEVMPNTQKLREFGWSPVLCRDEPQPGLFMEFVIVRQSPISGRVECLVHRCIHDQLQLLDELTLPDAFPAVEFGFEFFLPSVLSKVYRHVLTEGHTVLELPEAVTALWCLPAPVSSVRHGIRLRLLCRHKRSAQRAQINAPQRYHWLQLDQPAVLASLYLLNEQFRPKLYLL